ncbi:hypothetical protein KYB31_12370 [Clostridium felsineum]|uniref:hypothetical protein n=1 Tax=Clostridium felsineum TaxID=36839 RepID=UPI00214D4B04|nr:hypothetical protein [Clostridium felsineum]MCR3759768.1 hypothetical protein [Clostridium felsineum]
MSKRKKILIGDIFSFQITDEIMEILKIQPPDVFEMIMDVYTELKFKIGYCIVRNLKDNRVLIESKRVDIENPTLEEIKNSKTISISWTSVYALRSSEYKCLGNISIEAMEVKNFWSIAGKDYDDFLAGKDVEIYIQEVDAGNLVKFIATTHDVNTLKW